MSGAVKAITGGAPKEGQAAKDARARQLQSLTKQEAVAKRQTIDADKREEELSGQVASQRRAVAARRNSRGGLAFTGATSALKSTLGA